MRLIIAYLPPDLLETVLRALTRVHVHGMSVSHVQGFGQEHDEEHPDYRTFTAVEMTRKVRIEIGCHDEETDGILDAIYTAGHTGRRGNGKIFVLPMLDALRLKTGERGPVAIGTPAARPLPPPEEA